MVLNVLSALEVGLSIVRKSSNKCKMQFTPYLFAAIQHTACASESNIFREDLEGHPVHFLDFCIPLFPDLYQKHMYQSPFLILNINIQHTFDPDDFSVPFEVH